MATKMSKADRMSTSESLLADASIEDIRDVFQAIEVALTEFEDARSEAEEALAEALSYHEERDWESRNSSLEGAQERVEQMRDQINTLDEYTEWHQIPEDRMALMLDAVGQVESNLGFLMDF
jgi:hypothetical protein